MPLNKETNTNLFILQGYLASRKYYDQVVNKYISVVTNGHIMFNSLTDWYLFLIFFEWVNYFQKIYKIEGLFTQVNYRFDPTTRKKILHEKTQIKHNNFISS